MYKAFYEMQRLPFVRDIPPEKLYESPAMEETLGRLSYAADRQLFAVVTADSGCGKSTLVRCFAGTLSREEYILLYLSDSKLTPRWFYKGMLDQLGVEARFTAAMPKGSCRRKWRSSAAYRGRRWCVSLMRHTCWKGRPLRNSGSC